MLVLLKVKWKEHLIRLGRTSLPRSAAHRSEAHQSVWYPFSIHFKGDHRASTPCRRSLSRHRRRCGRVRKLGLVALVSAERSRTIVRATQRRCDGLSDRVSRSRFGFASGHPDHQPQ